MSDRSDTATNVRRDVGVAPRDIEDPNLAERVVAHIGAWALTVAERLSPPSGPFFPSDGRLLADATLFATPLEEPCHP